MSELRRKLQGKTGPAVRRMVHTLRPIRYIKSMIKGGIEGSSSYEVMPNSFASKIEYPYVDTGW